VVEAKGGLHHFRDISELISDQSVAILNSVKGIELLNFETVVGIQAGPSL
jgi:hypothetical protein